MLWGIEISKIDLSYMKFCERSIQLWTIYGHTLLKLSNFLYKSYRQKYVVTPKFLIKFGYYCNYYVVIWRNNFKLSLEDNRIFHPSSGCGLQWNMWD
jgi:hypothetical protein